MEKVKAVLKSIVTWVTIIQFALIVMSDEIAKLFPDDATDVVRALVMVIAILGSVLTLISRLTPVLEVQRGLVLPRNAPTTLILKRPPV